MTVFQALEFSFISVSDYVARVSKYFCCSKTCLEASYYYVSKVVLSRHNLVFMRRNVRMFSSHPSFFPASIAMFFAIISHTSQKLEAFILKELSNLKMNMLQMIDFRLNSPVSVIQQIENDLFAHINLLVSSFYPYRTVAPLVFNARTAPLESTRCTCHQCPPRSRRQHCDTHTLYGMVSSTLAAGYQLSNRILSTLCGDVRSP